VPLGPVHGAARLDHIQLQIDRLPPDERDAKRIAKVAVPRLFCLGRAVDRRPRQIGDLAE
jgi:hypothetical protein